MRTQSLTIFVAVAVFIPIVGCGNDQDSDSDAANPAVSNNNGAGDAPGGSSTSPGTDDNGAGGDGQSGAKAASIQEANAACDEIGEETAVRAAPYIEGEVSQRDRAAASRQFVSEVVVPGYNAKVRAIRGFQPPASDRERVAAILSAIQETVAEAKQEPLAFVRRTNRYGKPERLAREYGLPACGYP